MSISIDVRALIGLTSGADPVPEPNIFWNEKPAETSTSHFTSSLMSTSPDDLCKAKLRYVVANNILSVGG